MPTCRPRCRDVMVHIAQASGRGREKGRMCARPREAQGRGKRCRGALEEREGRAGVPAVGRKGWFRMSGTRSLGLCPEGPRHPFRPCRRQLLAGSRVLTVTAAGRGPFWVGLEARSEGS